MNGGDVLERYVQLCLRVDAHIEDFVDAYIGPAPLKEEVVAEGPHDPRGLLDEARALLDEVPGEELEAERVQWLLGQLRGLECVTARLSGEEISWADEVERCFGIRPSDVDEDAFRASHRVLDDALPGSGDLATRYNAWLGSAEVPRAAIPQAAELLLKEFRHRANRIVNLPAGERIDFESVDGVPWLAFNRYLGDYRSLVELNVDLPVSIIDLVATVAHEAYPGHHSERACKEKLLYRDQSRLEMSVMIVSAPEAVIAEGIATNALEAALGDEGFAALTQLAEGVEVLFDPAIADVVHREEGNLFGAATNAARRLHEDRMTPNEAEAYLQEWALYSPERAAQSVSFLMDPGSWTYATAYTDGQRICREFIDREEDGFKRLLTEQLTVSSLMDP
jgi:hypothetical protein